MLMQLGAVTQKIKTYMRKIKQQNDSEAILIKGVSLSFPTNVLTSVLPSTPNNVHMNKGEINLALIYRKMGMRYLLLFMASDTSGKIIIIIMKNQLHL